MSATASGSAGRALAAPPGTSLALLGGFHLVVDGVERLLSPSAERLVALLALQGRMTRSRAAGTLWPLIPESRALPRLRTCIWRVGAVAPGVLVATRFTVLLDPRVEVDVRATSGSGAPDPTAPPTYEGDLLPSWDDDWLLVERERLRQIHLHELDREANQLVAQGHFGPALAAAYAALGADPYRESALHTIMAVHLAEGNRSEADRVQVLLHRLREEGIAVRGSPPDASADGVPRPRGRR